MAMPTTKPMPPPPSRPAGNGETKAVRFLGIQRGIQEGPQRIVVSGAGGIGKTELAALLHKVEVEPVFVDLEGGTKFMDVARVNPESWDELRSFLKAEEQWRPFGAVVIDSLTKAEELTVPWILENVKHEKGHKVSNLEGYGWGKGLSHVFDAMLCLLGDLDAIIRAGKHVVCICHNCTVEVPNSEGENYLQYQPRLQSPKTSGKVRERVIEWADHLFYIGYDIIVGDDKKGKGGGSRTIYTSERPSHLAKSRTLSDNVPYARGNPEIWRKLFNKE